MATTTTNLGLTKPSYSDTADIAVINENMDKLDAAVNASEAGLAIMSNNNNHAAISKGQYVYVRKHGTLSEGLYKATANIATNGTLSSSNVTIVGDGLGGEIAAVANDVSSLFDQIANKANAIPLGELPAQKTMTVTFSTTVGFLLVVEGTSGSRSALSIVRGRNGATCYVSDVFSGANIVVTGNSGNITIQNTHTSVASSVYAFMYKGNPDDMTVTVSS